MSTKTRSVKRRVLTKRPINYDKTSFKVDGNQEIPEPYQRGVFQELEGAKTRQDNDRPYPFYNMDIGDSFLVPAETLVESDVIQRAVSGSACSHARVQINRGEVAGFATRKVKNGIRVFRIY